MWLTLSLLLAACGGDKNADNGKQSGENDGGKKDYGIKFLTIASGGTGGTYYPLGGTFATLIGDATGIEANSITSNASAENMASIQKEDVEVAFTQTDIATYATEGTNMFEEKIDNVQGLGTLYPETIQIVALKGSGIETVADLKGKTVSVGEAGSAVSVGEAGSGTRANAEQILEMYDMSVEDVKARNLSFDDSSTGLQDGTMND